MIDKTAAAMKEDDQMQKALWKWQSRFLFRRQAPQELLKSNDAGEEEGQDQMMDPNVPVLNDRVKKKMVNGELVEMSDDSSDKDSDDEESKEEEMPEEMADGQGDDDDFQEVKLCSKHAAFVRFRDKEGFFIHYATQNERSQQAVER